MTFHTGNPLTADAAKASIERTMEIGEGAAYIWGAVKKIDAPDDTTLVFHLSYRSPLDLVSSGTYSAYIYDTTASGGQDLGDWFADGNDAGTGPYMVAEYNPATRSSCASRPTRTTGAGGTTPITTSATSSASRPRRTPPPSSCARARSRWSSG